MPHYSHQLTNNRVQWKLTIPLQHAYAKSARVTVYRTE